MSDTEKREWLSPEEARWLDEETGRVRARLCMGGTDTITVNGEGWLMLLLKDYDHWRAEVRRLMNLPEEVK